MTAPIAYQRLASFSNIQAQAPTEPLPGGTVDAEFNAIKATLDEVIGNLALIQRDDGLLANGIVGPDQLSDELAVGINAWTVWVTATEYAAGDTVFRTSAVYRCLVAHTSGTFSTDLSAAKWELVLDFAALTLGDASQIVSVPAGTLAAATVQAALNELDTEKAPVSHTHLASAIADSTAAGRNMLKAADVAAQQVLLGLGDLAFVDDITVDEIPGELVLSGIIEPAALASNTNDWAPTGIATATTIRMSASQSINLTGLLAPANDGTILTLQNIGSTYTITLLPESSSSAAANRIAASCPADVRPGEAVLLQYDADATTPRWRVCSRVLSRPLLPRGYIDGLTLSNNGSDATNDLDVAVGEARGALGILDLRLTSAVTGKRLDADWAVGAGAGMRYSGAAIANATYHIFLIGKLDGTVDVFAYTGTDPSAVLPSGYVDYRMIGSIIRASNAILAFIQHDDLFLLKTVVVDLSTASSATSRTNVTVTVPSGLRVIGLFNAATDRTGGNSIYLSCPDGNDQAPSLLSAPLSTLSIAANGIAGGPFPVLTSTSAQIAYRTSASDDAAIATVGWHHPRGRNL